MSALPHVSTLHEGEHPSHEWLFPSSHSSPSSTTPLPHWAGGVPHGGRFTFCAMTGGGVSAAPKAICGNRAGSRYSSRLRADVSVPPIVIGPLAWNRFSPVRPSDDTTAPAFTVT